MDFHYQIYIRDKDSTLTRVFFALLLMEQLKFDWKKCINPPQELIDWCKSYTQKGVTHGKNKTKRRP